MKAQQKTIQKEFSLTDDDFNYLSDLAYKHAGIYLSSEKRELVYGRIAKRLRILKLNNFRDYCKLLKSENNNEAPHFINSITTNVTAFFRENHHFEYMADTLLPQLIEKNSSQAKPKLRIWSAGCSTGEEPYSIAMVLGENINEISRWDIKILATDLDSTVLETARNGIYSMDRIDNVSEQRRKRWMSRGIERNDGNIRVKQQLRDLVYYKQLNLNDDWPIHGTFDFIFFRNVAIYFKRETQVKILNRLAEHLETGGILFVGHSESLVGISENFRNIGQTIYIKK